MGIEQLLIEKVRQLPPALQLDALAAIEKLARSSGSLGKPRHERHSLYGSWADLGVSITEDEIAELRREMWGNFPREF